MFRYFSIDFLLNKSIHIDYTTRIRYIIFIFSILYTSIFVCLKFANSNIDDIYQLLNIQKKNEKRGKNKQFDCVDSLVFGNV